MEVHHRADMAAAGPSSLRGPATGTRVLLQRWLHGHGTLNAGVNADVDDVESHRVLIAALHLLHRHASLRVAMGAPVVGPAYFAPLVSCRVFKP